MEENKSSNELISEKTKNEQKPLLWYYFYNFILLPLLTLRNISSISLIENYLNTSNLKSYTLSYMLLITELVISVILIIIKIVLFFKMIQKNQSTLKLLKISIYTPSIICIISYIINIFMEISNQNFENIIAYTICIAIIIIWALLNVSYFEDRKEIFKN